VTAPEFVSIANEIIFAVIFLVTAMRAARLRTVPSLDIAVLFGLIVAAQQLNNLFELIGLEESVVAAKVSLVVLPWLAHGLLRITDHFAPQRRWFMLGALSLTVAITAVAIVSPVPTPNAVIVLVVAWFVVAGAYASGTFIGEARRAPGVTSRRLGAAALGSGLLALALVVAVVALLALGIGEWAAILTQLLITAAGLSYYVGFATPSWLRRAWQEPSIRTFLAHSAELTREPDDTAMIRDLQRLAAEAMGVPNAAVGLASPDGRVLRWVAADEPQETPSDRWIAGRAFTDRRAVFSRSPMTDDPENADGYREAGVEAIMAAPIGIGEHRFGVLLFYAPRVPLFAYTDLQLSVVLAQQAAGILESRQLLREATEVHAREVAARAKEDFLSAAAHDLRTPLSSMVLRAELLRKRMERDDSPHLPAVDAVLEDARRVTEFVGDLLDAARAEQGRLSTAEEPVDLAELTRETAERFPTGDHHEVSVFAPTEAWVTGDRRRLQQVVENLLSNARKYSPDGGPITVEVTATDGTARVSVRDRGIGVAEEDHPNLFQRFSRGRNVDDRRFSGMGLGLYICRRIVEEHGGTIWAESEVGVGTTMRFALPSHRKEAQTDG
jgi:signal transduction histidine kinase